LELLIGIVLRLDAERLCDPALGAVEFFEGVFAGSFECEANRIESAAGVDR